MRSQLLTKKYAFLILVLFLISKPFFAQAATTYDFEADTIGATPANVTVTAGTFQVQNQATLGKSLVATTQLGVIAGAIFSNFTGSADQSVVWKQAYSTNTGRGGFTLRAQSADTSVSVGARQGYLFHVYDSNAVYIWKVGPSSYTALYSGSLAKAEPRWFKAVVVGNQQGFYYSNDGINYTLIASTTDSTYATGTVQYTAGYGLAVNQDYVDNVVITNLDFDGTPPSVSALSPADNATSTAVAANLVMTFTEPVIVATGTVRIYKTSDNSLVESIPVVSGQVTGSGTNTITINPAANLDESTGYYVRVDAGAVEDLAGNDFAGITDNTTWNFTTGDFTNPTISTFFPQDNSADVALDADLTLTFNEAVLAGTGTVSIYKTDDNSLVEAINVVSGQVTGTTTNTITIHPSSDLTYGTGYYVRIDAGAFRDGTGNSFAGITASTTWNFVTIAAPIVARPSISYWSPGSSSADYRANSLSPKKDDLCMFQQTNRTLRKGSRGEDVRDLQKFLNCLGFTVAISGPGSAGNETDQFSIKTRDAVVRFQEQYSDEILKPIGAIKGTGIFGEMSKKTALSLKVEK